MPGMGRIEAPDERDANYPARAALTPAPAFTPFTKYHMMLYTLNQGETGTCVGHGWKELLLSAPCSQGKPDTSPTAFDIYDDACSMDEFSENDHDVQRRFGTSVRGGAKALQKRGLIGEYRWANDAATIIQWICEHGPVVLGTDWRESMFDPDPNGVLHVDPGSRIVGGHCYLAIGYSVQRDALRILNSWGKTWGQNGRVWLPRNALDFLMMRRGEACMTLDIRLAA